MKVITQAIRVIDYENNKVLTRDILPNFSEYIEQLISYINGNVSVREYRTQSRNTEVIREVYWSSFLVTLCSEIMLYIETPLVSYSYSLNEVSHSCTS